MALRVNYVGIADFRIIKRATLTANGLIDPGFDLIWSKANSYELDVSNDVGLYLLAQGGEFATDPELNFGGMLLDFVPGPAGVWRGEYDPLATYTANDLVEYEGSTFICTIGGSGVAPPEPEFPAVTITGPAGATGADGGTGAQGIAGLDGTDGTDGAAGLDGKGLELNYVETTSNISNATGTAIDALSCPVTTTGKIEVKFITTASNNTALSGVTISLYEDGVLIDVVYPKSTAANDLNRVNLVSRRNPSPGPHTYLVKFVRFTSGTATLSAGGIVVGPTSLSVVTR